jgi:hypothetical protein
MRHMYLLSCVFQRNFCPVVLETFPQSKESRAGSSFIEKFKVSHWYLYAPMRLSAHVQAKFLFINIKSKNLINDPAGWPVVGIIKSKI